MKKKILVVMLAVGMVATSLTGCAFETESKKGYIQYETGSWEF